MAITRDDFHDIFRQVVSAEFSHIPVDENSIDIQLSPAFLKRMEKLFRKQKRFYWSFVNTGFKRAAVAVALAAMLFATACSIPPVRKGIVDFAEDVYDTFIRYFAQGDVVAHIEKEYVPKELPEGFQEVKKEKTCLKIRTKYEDENGNVLKLVQSTTKEVELLVDVENGTAYQEEIEGIEVSFFKSDCALSASWVYDQYYFQVIGFGEVNADLIQEFILSLE